MTLRSRAFWLLAAAIAAAVISGVAVQWVFTSVRDNQLRTIGELYPASDNVGELLVATSDMESGVDGYVLTGETSFLTPYVLGRTRAASAQAELRQQLTLGAPDLVPLLDRIDANIARWLEVAAEPQIALVRSGNREAAQQAIAQSAGRRAYTSLRSDLAVLNEQLDERVAGGAAEIARVSRWLLWAMIATAVATVAVLGAATWAMNAWVLQPLGDLRRQMRGLTQAGDRTTPLVPSGPPEVAGMGRDAEDLRRSLVSATDISIAAVEGLAQEGPLVSSLQHYLEGPTAVEIDGYAVASASLSAEGAVTGDWWTMVTDGPVPTAVVADVSGHGVPAARVAVQMKGFIRLALSDNRGAADVFADISRLLTDEPATFASCVTVALEGDQVRYCNAGHLAPVVLRADDGSVSELAPTGPIISAIPGQWTEARQPLRAGDVTVLYTDGLVEARNEAGQDVETTMLIEWIRQLHRSSGSMSPQRSAQHIADGLLDCARNFATDVRRDDVTVVVILRVAPAADPTGASTGGARVVAG